MLRGYLYNTFGEFQMAGWGFFWKKNPKLVEWVNFKKIGFKVNLVTKLYQSETYALPNNVNGGEFVKGYST